MIPKIYISGQWEDRTKIHDLIKKFSEICEVCHDWTVHEDESLLNNKVYLKCQTLLGEDCISKSDYVVAIMENPNYIYTHTWTEIGIAIGTDVPILIYSPQNIIQSHMYSNHHLIRVFSNLNDIVKYLTNN